LPIQSIDGMMLKDMFLSGAALLAKNRESIDALNVFPVPDGDTGTNMTQTMATAVKELASRTFPTVSDVASTVAKGALKGARGNSGVILSQILRGIARALEGAEEMDAQAFIRALRSGADTAYKAVMKPKEGTILTVARVIAEELEREKTTDMLELMRKVLSVGDAILKRTPEMLPVLKQAGVVDSGGKGLMVVYAGFYAALSGEPVEQTSPDQQHKGPPLPGEFVDDHESLEEIKFAYCTEFIVSHPKPDLKDSEVARLRKRLERIGDCVLVVGDLEVVKVHVHTNEPGKALQMALELGELDGIKIDNMLEEYRERLAKRPPEPELKEFGMVSVALGKGLTEIFRDMAVDQVVDGGQTMNPSIDELVQAIESTRARQVFVLPNNTNIILAAQQAAELTDKTVYVIPTKSVPMGIAAAIAFMPDLSGEENAANMTEAAERVHTAAITYAVRDTTFDDREIHEGDIMGLVDNRIVQLGADPAAVAEEILRGMVTEDSELITIYYGEDTPAEQAEALSARLAEAYPSCDVSVYLGGQPLYYYLIAVE
jgi:DAK2 domain fusion protein YloV